MLNRAGYNGNSKYVFKSRLKIQKWLTATMKVSGSDYDSGSNI